MKLKKTNQKLYDVYDEDQANSLLPQYDEAKKNEGMVLGGAGMSVRDKLKKSAALLNR